MIASTTAHAQALQHTRADPAAIRAALGGSVDVPAPVRDWLAALALLEGVPLAYLVPDPALLPPESIRFFHLDANWIVALLGGATSVGRSSSADLQHDQAVASALHAEVGAEPEVTGFVLRSAVVAGWPEIDVAAFAYNEDGVTPQSTPLPILRLERIAPGVLFCLVAGVIGQIHLREPPEGLHFGLDVDEQDTVLDAKELRPTSGPQAGLANPKTTADVTWRGTRDRRVLDVATTAASISTALGNTRVTAAELALELVEGTQAVRFAATGTSA